MADEITRESHYVPQATLKRWSLDGIHLSGYRLLVSHPDVPVWQSHTIGGLARQRDLYTFDGHAEPSRSWSPGASSQRDLRGRSKCRSVPSGIW